MINRILLFVTLLAGAATLHGCSDPDGIIEDVAYDREFSPLNFTCSLSNNVNADFSWTVMTGISDYTLTLSYADGDGGVYDVVDLIAPLDEEGLTVKTMDYSFRELPGNRAWRAELVAVSQRPGVADSKPAVCAFETGIENLFLNEGKMGDGDVTATTALLRWVAGSNVTHLAVTPDIGRIDLSQAAIAAGEYQLTELVTGTTYTVELLRDEAVRGTVTFVASDKIDVEVVDKTATTVTLAWGAAEQVSSLALKGGDDERTVELTEEQIAAHTYTFEGLKAQTEYAVTVFIAGVESGSLVVTTLGQSAFWDFTDASKWSVVSWETNQTVDGLTILAASGKNVEIREDADYGCNYLDLRGKSTVKQGEAPTQRAVQLSVVGEGVLAIDCYANGAGRNFYAYVDALGKSFGPYEAPTSENRGKVFIPCPGIPASATVTIWTDATINHIYSIGWYEGTEAPGQNATPLDAPVVAADPAEVTKGDQTPVTFSWAAVPNAATYTYRLTLTALDGETEETVRFSQTVTATQMTVPAETVARLKPGTYTIAVTAAAVSDYLYKPSPAGSGTLTVADTKLAAPEVKLDPAKVTVGATTEVVASWAAVEGAGSYEVVFNNGAAETVTATSYAIPAATVAALAVGEYALAVVALPADASAQSSDPGTAKLTVAEAGGQGGGTLTWNFTDASFDEYYAQIGEANNDAFNAVWNGLTITSGKTIKCGTNSGMRYIQTGGAGTATQRCFSFEAPASGKLTVVASNTGSSEDLTRMVTVAVGGSVVGSLPGGYGSATPTACAFDLTVEDGQTVTIYPTGNGLRFYSFEYVYGGGSGGGDAKTDYTMTLSATAGVLSSNISGLPTSWKDTDSEWTATDDTGASTIAFTGNVYYSTSGTKNIVWYFNKGKAETHVAASELGRIRKITVFPNSARKPELLTCTYGPNAAVLPAVEPTGTNSATITFDFETAGVESGDFRIDFTDTGTNIEVGKTVIEYTK